MSVQTEITRLSNAKSAIKTAIGNKGVTVPSTTKLDGMATLIGQIPTGIDTSDATATSSDILSGKTAYVNGSKVTGAISTKAAATYNTSTSNQTIAAGQYLSGAQTIRAVTTSNLSAANIKSGVVVKVGDAGSAGRIANVTGTYTGKTKDDFGIESYVPSNLSEGTDGLIFLRTGYISVAGGQYNASTTKKYYMTQSGTDGSKVFIVIDDRPLYVVCGLDWIVWWGWTYSSTTYTSATRALTGSGYSGANAIRVPYSSTDKRFCLSFRKSDTSVFTDDELTALKNSIKFVRVVDL